MKTQRDAWCYNASRATVATNIKKTVTVYNDVVDRLMTEYPGLDKKSREAVMDNVITTDPTKISWTSSLRQGLVNSRKVSFDESSLCSSLYRPFNKEWLYFNRSLNERVYQMPRLFPYAEAENLLIVIKQRLNNNGNFSLMTDHLIELQTDGGTQCFPLYLYEPIKSETTPKSGMEDLFAEAGEMAAAEAQGYRRRDAITDEGLAHFQDAYPDEKITKEDLFYYVYGLLHSPDYRARFADNLSKELPRIPSVQVAADFWAFSKAGRALGDLHVNYEAAPQYAGVTITGESDGVSYRVEKMRYGGKGGKDKSILHYNGAITVSGIPLDAYDYVVNGKSALDWVVERQRVKVDKASGIVNDANDWATETMNNPRYPLDLFLRLITVSLETLAIVRTLPKLEI
ncbi:type ISP restriction/modification enzyme [Rhodospirillum sp. A1_3_36]|uniref:type ISP restriction/modification enzyme n=1 Tax=Rhodospirillum sp. A1_3_36 TaxID=3391666 RepID=UPI0039A75E69